MKMVLLLTVTSTSDDVDASANSVKWLKKWLHLILIVLN